MLPVLFYISLIADVFGHRESQQIVIVIQDLSSYNNSKYALIPTRDMTSNVTILHIHHVFDFPGSLNLLSKPKKPIWTMYFENITVKGSRSLFSFQSAIQRKLIFRVGFSTKTSKYILFVFRNKKLIVKENVAVEQSKEIQFQVCVLSKGPRIQVLKIMENHLKSDWHRNLSFTWYKIRKLSQLSQYTCSEEKNLAKRAQEFKLKTKAVLGWKKQYFRKLCQFYFKTKSIALHQIRVTSWNKVSHSFDSVQFVLSFLYLSSSTFSYPTSRFIISNNLYLTVTGHVTRLNLT